MPSSETYYYDFQFTYKLRFIKKALEHFFVKIHGNSEFSDRLNYDAIL